MNITIIDGQGRQLVKEISTRFENINITAMSFFFKGAFYEQK